MQETQPAVAAPEAPAAEELWDRARREIAEWRAQAAALVRDAGALAPLANAKAYQDLAKLAKVFEKVDAKLAKGEPGRGVALAAALRAEVARREETRRRELARQLQEECQRRGLELAVVRREEPVEVRIPPFAVEIDRAKGRATLRFARLPIETCAADAAPIAALVESVRDAWSRDFRPAPFFEACRAAWQAARATGLGGAGERVEIADLLPFLALQLQPKKFRRDPAAKHFVDYSRARFAFDLMQLRRSGHLLHDDWRLNLGVATGTTASDKSRALFVEDERGQGEYKLTVYFTRG